MAQIKLYIASSLDGYVAREDGSLDWLEGHPNPDKLDYGYHDFVLGIDTVVMGRNTYDEILGFGVDWPYADCTSYIITSDITYQPKTERTIIVNQLDESLITMMKEQSEKGVWLVGGGQLITEFLNMEAIDEIQLFIIPIIIGKGIPLFPNGPKESNFDLTEAKAYSNGVAGLFYARK